HFIEDFASFGFLYLILILYKITASGFLHLSTIEIFQFVSQPFILFYSSSTIFKSDSKYLLLIRGICLNPNFSYNLIAETSL
ncbi:hypothetical protein, partial [Tissierella sp. P1]|uniref:hypothetical protein n=1 Tax=Tissierella sp. P1 TaxID=1280483 RepID=UPI001F312029